MELAIQQNKDANERMEAQSRRRNLIIYGIQGDKKESWETSEFKLRDNIRDELNIDESRIQTERVHRLKKDRDAVLKAYRQKSKDERESAPTEGDRRVDTD